MTNLDFIRKATLEDLAKMIEKRLKCDGCFLSDRCVGHYTKGCRETVREWLTKEYGDDE